MKFERSDSIEGDCCSLQFKRKWLETSGAGGAGNITKGVLILSNKWCCSCMHWLNSFASSSYHAAESSSPSMTPPPSQEDKMHKSRASSTIFLVELEKDRVALRGFACVRMMATKLRTKRHSVVFMKVLKGHIALGNARFPNGTNGHALDILARVRLWKDGLDYRHGTVHGIGSYLNIHEEPGYYEDGNFGIRLENVLIVNDAGKKFNFGDKGYLSFEHITWAPYQRKLMDLKKYIGSIPIIQNVGKFRLHTWMSQRWHG